MKQYKNAVIIGRFQPIHNGHIELFNKAFSLAENVIVLIGSCNGPRTYKNPFSFEQRRNIIFQMLALRGVRNEAPYTDAKLSIKPLKDYKYNDDKWMHQVQNLVPQGSTVLVGFKKDHSTRYLDWFPQWEYFDVEEDPDSAAIDATTVRSVLFEGKNTAFIRSAIPEASYSLILEFKDTEEYKRIKEEYDVIQAYKKSWAAAPYPPTFVCTDAVVLCHGHVLMIRRKAQPGKGLWALPGGFLDQNEWIKDCAVRELIEETKIDIPSKVLHGSITASKVFDHPGRSERGRTITHAYRFDVQLTPKGKLPKVKGGDDAAEAKWIPLGELNEDVIYEDHYSIIDTMIG